LRKAGVGIVCNRDDEFFDYGLHNRKERKIEGGHGSVDLGHARVFEGSVNGFHLAACVDHEGTYAGNS
jgi:hypothetical protein